MAFSELFFSRSNCSVNCCFCSAMSSAMFSFAFSASVLAMRSSFVKRSTSASKSVRNSSASSKAVFMFSNSWFNSKAFFPLSCVAFIKSVSNAFFASSSLDNFFSNFSICADNFSVFLISMLMRFSFSTLEASMDSEALTRSASIFSSYCLRSCLSSF